MRKIEKILNYSVFFKHAKHNSHIKNIIFSFTPLVQICSKIKIRYGCQLNFPDYGFLAMLQMKTMTGPLYYYFVEKWLQP